MYKYHRNNYLVFKGYVHVPITFRGMPTSLVNTEVVKIRYLHRKMRNCRDQNLTVNVLYLACMIFGVFQNFSYLYTLLLKTYIS